MSLRLLISNGWLALALAVWIILCPALPVAADQDNNHAMPIAVEAAVDKPSATIGDVITLTLRVRHDQDFQIQLPEFKETIEGFVIIDHGSGKPRSTNGKIEQEFWYRLRADAVGSFTLPQVPVLFTAPDPKDPAGKIPGSIQTPEIGIEVRSVLRLQGEPTDIRAIKPIVESSGELPLHLLGPLLGLIATLLALILYWRERKRPRTALDSAKELLPHELALRQLDVLQAKRFLERGQLREHYFELSEIFRRYLGTRYEFPALDWTTEEIFPHLVRRAELTDPLRQRVESILVRTDQVKFAKQVLDPTVSQEIMQSIVQFIQTTKKIPEEEHPAPVPSALGP